MYTRKTKQAYKILFACFGQRKSSKTGRVCLFGHYLAEFKEGI